MKKTKSTIKHHKQASWVKFALVGVALSIVALVVAGLQYGVGPVAQLTGKSPTINKLTETVTSGKPQEKKTTVTLTQTEAQERRGTGTVTNSETGQVIRHTDNVENPFSAVPKASSYCSASKEKECSSLGQRCVVSVYGGVCQKISGNTTTNSTTTITATGASCAGKWTSIGSGSWAQWGGTKAPDGTQTNKQVCIQCVNGVWDTKGYKDCGTVPYIPRPDEVSEGTIGTNTDLACFANGTWYSTGSNTGTQTCSKGHWCNPGQEWNGTACVTAQATNTTSSSQYQPSSCTPGNTWCEGNNLGTCTEKKSKSYSYCPNTPGMTCVESSATKAECKLTGSASTGNIALSYACGSGAGGTKLSIEKQSNGVTIYRQCDSKGCGSDGKCVGTTLGPINPNQPPTTASNPTTTTSTFACGSNSKGAISTERKSDGTSVVHQCGTKGCNTSTGKCSDSAPTTPTSTSLSADQKAKLQYTDKDWSASNPIRTTNSADCPAGSTIKQTSGGFGVIWYSCTPKETANTTTPTTQTNQPTNPAGVISKPVVSGNTSYSCNGSTAVVTDKASNTIMNTTQCFDLGCNPNTGKCNESRTTTNSGNTNPGNPQTVLPKITDGATGTLLENTATYDQTDCKYGGVDMSGKYGGTMAHDGKVVYECKNSRGGLGTLNSSEEGTATGINPRITSTNAVEQTYSTGSSCANAEDCRKCPDGIYTRLQVTGQAFPSLVCGTKAENSSRANSTTTVTSDNSSQYTLSVGQVCNDGILSSNKCSKCPGGTYSTVLPSGNAGPNGAGAVKVCGSSEDLKSTDLSAIRPGNARGAVVGGTVGGLSAGIACAIPATIGCAPLLGPAAPACGLVVGLVCGAGGAAVGAGVGAAVSN